MEMLKDLLILIVGFVLLIKGADYFVEGSSSVAKFLKIPSIVVGLTIVAMGTSLPELSVSFSAAMNGSNEIAISNVVGSNIFNLIVVLGACSLLTAVPVDKSILKRDFPFSIIIAVALALMFADNIMPWAGSADEGVGMLSRFDGIVLLVFFIGYLAVTVKGALNDRKNHEDSEDEEKAVSLPLSIVFIVCGIIAIKFGGDFVVNSARDIALALGMTENLVGLTIVAMGTSLPELVTSMVAAKKGETGLAVGNVIGSNIFNILLILGVSSTISPITAGSENVIDTIVLIVSSIIIYVFSISRKKIERKEGFIMLLMYAGYMAYAILR